MYSSIKFLKVLTLTVLTLSTMLSASINAYAETQESNDYPCIDDNSAAGLELATRTPSILEGVKKVFILGAVPNTDAFKKLNLSTDKLKSETACQYKNYLKVWKPNITVQPLYITGKLSDSKEIKDPDNLIIRVNLTNNTLKYNNQLLNVFTLQQIFFRSSVNEPNTMGLQCATSFLGEPSDHVNSDLITAIKYCIPRRF